MKFLGNLIAWIFVGVLWYLVVLVVFFFHPILGAIGSVVWLFYIVVDFFKRVVGVDLDS